MAKILIVEDDKLLRRAIKEEFEESGYEVDIAENYEEVMMRLRSSSVSMIYLDIMLPGDLDGFGILKKLKAEESEFKDIPVIMLSNIGQMEQIDLARELGALDFIVKSSIDLPKLVEVTKKRIG